MITIADLQTSLLDLFHEIEGSEVEVIIGGGFGIYLKVVHVAKEGPRTLWQEWPEPRSTNDLDVFPRPELLIESEKLKPLAAAIERLGYLAVAGAEKYQFVKPGPGGADPGSVKIDILTGPQSRFKGTKVRADARRARPHPSIGIHAHSVDEALTLEDGLLSIVLSGVLSSGESSRAEIFLLHPYTFALMKLFAFRDRVEDANKDFGRYHALDLYTILAATIEDEWAYALKLRDQNRGKPGIVEAGRLVSKHFSGTDRLGILRLRESPYYRAELRLDEFMSVLQELFP
jgi:hypothetical protein